MIFTGCSKLTRCCLNLCIKKPKCINPISNRFWSHVQCPKIPRWYGQKKMYNTLCSSVAYFTYPVIYSLKKYRSKHASSTVTCFHFVHYVRALPSSCLSSPFPHWHFTAFLGVEVGDCRIENTWTTVRLGNFWKISRKLRISGGNWIYAEIMLRSGDASGRTTHCCWI